LCWEPISVQRDHGQDISSALLPLWLETSEAFSSLSDIRCSGSGTPTANYDSFVKLMALLQKFNLEEVDSKQMMAVVSKTSTLTALNAHDEGEDDDEDDDGDGEELMKSVPLQQAEATLKFVSTLREQLDSNMDNITKHMGDKSQDDRHRLEANLSAKYIEEKILSRNFDERNLVKNTSSVSDSGDGTGNFNDGVNSSSNDNNNNNNNTNGSDMSLSDALEFASKIRNMEKEATKAQRVHYRRSKSVANSDHIMSPFHQAEEEEGDDDDDDDDDEYNTGGRSRGTKVIKETVIVDNSDALLKLQEMFQAEIESVKRKQMFSEV
jgi:hypothetical protein